MCSNSLQTGNCHWQAIDGAVACAPRVLSLKPDLIVHALNGGNAA